MTTTNQQGRFTAPLPTGTIRLSRGSNTNDNQPKQIELPSFAALWDMIDTDRGATKGQQYICGPMAKGLNTSQPDKFRGEAHWRQAHLAVNSQFLRFDCDVIPKNMLDPLISSVDEYAGCSYTTSSHTPENPRARLIIALSRPAPRDECIRLGKAFERYLVSRGIMGVEFDRSVYRPEQQCYLPLEDADFIVHEGTVSLNIDELLASEFSRPEDDKGKKCTGIESAQTGFNTLPVDAQRELCEKIKAGLQAHKEVGKTNGYDSAEAKKIADDLSALGAGFNWCWKFNEQSLAAVIADLTKDDVNELDRGQWSARVMLAARFAPICSNDAERILEAVQTWSQGHKCYEGYKADGNNAPELTPHGGAGDPFKDFDDRWSEGERNAHVDNSPFKKLWFLSNIRIPVPQVLLADGSAFNLFEHTYLLELSTEKGLFGDTESTTKADAETAWQTRARIIEQIVNSYNERYFIATEGGRNFVYDEDSMDELNFSNLNRTNTTAFREIRRTQLVQLPTGGTNDNGKPEYQYIPEVELWWKSPKRRAYTGGLRLIPTGKCPSDVYNLWKGFGVDTTQGDASTILQFILGVVCNNSQQSFNYLMGWLAYGVQHPERQAEVAVVMRGGKGIGKGTLGKIMKRIYGTHALQITNVKHLTGNFNGHLRSTLLLFADEAFWAGDKAGESVLKGLVTESTLTIEQKGVDAYPVLNRIKILMASNSEWVVPASADERRFFVLDVSDERQGDHEYWTTINRAINSDECIGAFLSYLLDYNLNNFNIRTPPNTKGLDDQKLSSLDPINAVLFEALEAGELGVNSWPINNPLEYNCASFKSLAVEYCKTHKRHNYDIPNNSSIGKEIKKTFGNIRKRGQTIGKDRPWIYQFPALDEARGMFCSRHRLTAPPWGESDSV